MRNVRVDTTGELRCWHCGCTSFKEKRTFRSKALMGVGSLLTKQKLKCQVCGEYNDVGNAQPYKGPASKRLGRKYGTLVAMFGAEEPDRVIASAYDVPGAADVLPIEARPPAVMASPAGWHPDPHRRHELRYWDGAQWTAHVSDRGVVSTDAG
jgi:hypothetical protein